MSSVRCRGAPSGGVLVRVLSHEDEQVFPPLVGVRDAGVEREHVVVPLRLGDGRVPGDDGPYSPDRSQVHVDGPAGVPFDEVEPGPAPQRPLAREVVLVPVADELRFGLVPARPHGARVHEPDRVVPGPDRCAERKSREDVDPRRGVVVSAVRGPPRAAVRHPPTPGGFAGAVLRPPVLVGRSHEHRLEHHLLVVSAKRGVEPNGRLRPSNPVQGVERARTAVDQVPEAEDAVMLVHLELGERPAKRREVPVHAANDEVAAAVVALDGRAEVRTGRREGDHCHASWLPWRQSGALEPLWSLQPMRPCPSYGGSQWSTRFSSELTLGASCSLLRSNAFRSKGPSD